MGKSNPIKWNYNMVKKYIENEGYILNSKIYVRKRDKLEMTCPNGHKINLSFDCFCKGVRCGECYRNNPRYDRRQTIDEVRQIVESEDGYELLSTEYIPGKKIEVKHRCGNIYKVTLNNFKRGKRCIVCKTKENSEKRKIKKEYVISEVNKYGFKVISLEGFEKSDDKLKLQCPNNHEFEVSWNSFQQGSRCPHCKTSKGENKIKKYLDDNNLYYFQQYKFKHCKNIRELPFDFYLPDYNICIEYDGEQHYKPINYNGKMTIEEQNKRLEYYKNNDDIKNNYCQDNNIKLIRIPYWESDNIDKILDNIIKTFNDYPEEGSRV